MPDNEHQTGAFDARFVHSRAWDYFKEFEAAERHFNNLQSQYRTLASTWLLAAFAGIGFVITQPRLAIPVDPLLVVSGIGAAASLGITLLWNLDLRVYHALMFEYFKAGRELEQHNPSLPQVRTNINKTMKGRGVTGRVALFYIAGNSVMLIVASLGVISWLYRKGVLLAMAVVPACVMLIAALGLWMFFAAVKITNTDRKFLTSRKELS